MWSYRVTKMAFPATVVYLNLGSFDFEEKVISAPSFSSIKAADLDNDGRPEWIVSGTEERKFSFEDT